MEQKLDGKYNGHAYVDMGLSVMWATCNVGASSPEEYGDYYAWGETSTKSVYDEDNCATWKKDMYDISGTSRDVARAKWGGKWRMPTPDEFYELLDECTWEWTTRNGVNGYKVTGPNGNFIFLPAAGFRKGTSLHSAGDEGNYWSSTPDEDFNCDSYFRNRDSYYLDFCSDYPDVNWLNRKLGLTVRPVTVYVSFNDKIMKSSEQAKIGIGGTINGHEWVDLGLSVKWATCNVGASSPEGYGDYYAWGETSTKSSYDEGNCATLRKEMGDISGTSRDVARAKWGGKWRMPTEAEFHELVNECTWEWTFPGGHDGYKVTGPNGNSIFLPAAGYHYGMLLRRAGDVGCYWSSTPDDNGNYWSTPGNGIRGSYPIEFYNGCARMHWSCRSYGYTVRPVTE